MFFFQAFSVYLHCILQRLSDFDDAKDDSSQIELVLKFLQKVIIVFYFLLEIMKNK
jgi:hypothetical protein